MPGFEYRMIQVPPTITVKAKEFRGNEAAMYLQDLANQQAGEGWEFFRVDEIGVVTQPGCLMSFIGKRSELFTYYVVTFRRQR